MQNDWAAENLQTIRTLMERSALYRRALAPVMITVGITGILGAIIRLFLHSGDVRAFVGFWMVISVLALTEAFLLIRLQALKDAEPLWSPPTRRVVQAVLPPFLVGFVAGIPFLITNVFAIWAFWLLPAWMVLYGLGLHAAGFFMPRRLMLFGWSFILCGCVFGFFALYGEPLLLLSYLDSAMGLFFGGAHLAFGIYLFFTEKRQKPQ